MNKHPDCAEVCRQADQYGVWPEHSCRATCVWLKYSGNPLNEPPTDAEKQRVRAELGCTTPAACYKQGCVDPSAACEERKPLYEPCCENEKRNMNGGCDNCGDPCF